MHRLAWVVLLTFLLHGRLLRAEESVVRLYPGAASGSETWTHTEKEQAAPGIGRIAYNVVNPTLTVFPAEPAKRNGAAVVICPGGAFFLLSMDSEGYHVARALCARGMTCFVLKYRLVECKTDNPWNEMLSRGRLDPVVAPIVPLAAADGMAAVKHVRENAKEYGVRPNRIGILGFSAGGTVASSVAFHYAADSRPDFAAPIYLAYRWTLKSKGVPADAPPMFLLAATDDPLGLAHDSVDLYRDWTAAKKPAELHLFAKGGHGFGMRKQGLPTDRWLDRFTDWLQQQGFYAK